MGTWDVGPFDNDTAADFAGDLDEAAVEEREPMIRRALKRAADATEFLDTPDAERAAGPGAARTWCWPTAAMTTTSTAAWSGISA